MQNWTKEQEEYLLMYVNEGLTTEEIARKMSRSYKSIQHRRAELTRDNPRPIMQDKEEKELSQKEINSMVVNALQEKLSTFKAYPSSPAKITGKGDTLVIHLTDLHSGKIVKDQNGNVIYNEEIFKARMEECCQQILGLLDNHIKRGVPITDVVILSTGDNANGENIYATQAYEQELAPPYQVMLVVEVITRLIKSLLNRGLKVSLYGVKGNHGRISKEANPVDNWDIMIYLILDFWAKYVLKDKKLSIKYADTDYMTLDIKNKKYLIRHIAPEQSDSPSGRVKINEWARQHGVDAVVYGHWHHFGVNDVDGVRVFRGGSIVGGDSLSESMAKHSEPMQCIWGVNEDRVMTFFYAVDLATKGK